MTSCRRSVLALLLLLPGLTQCEPWEEGPPPATAANASAAPASPDELAAPLPPGPPISSDGSSTTAGTPQSADGAPRYASDEYAIGADTDTYDDRDPSALTDFRAPLEPYGTWTDDATYGTVWVPSNATVGADFTPYVSAGHWAYDDDYVWVSDYPWGWAPFHYGRWVFIEGRGWAWIPGREYRGAWVTWSVDDGYSYLGWAPMGPSFIWFGGTPVGWRGYWGPRWCYVPRGEVFAPRVGARVIVGPSAVAIGARMRPYGGPDARGSGPPPARFGFAAAQVPRVSGAAAVSVNHAQQFARPSTARPLGATAPTRIESRPTLRPSGEGQTPLVTGPRSGLPNAPRPMEPSFQNGPRTVGPSVGAPRFIPPMAPQPSSPRPVTPVTPRTVAPSPTPNAARVQAMPSPAPARVPSAPTMRPGGGSFRGGGAIHRR